MSYNFLVHSKIGNNIIKGTQTILEQNEKQVDFKSNHMGVQL